MKDVMETEVWLDAERAPPEVSATIAMDLLRRSTGNLRLMDLSNLPDRLDDMTLAAVREIADCPLPVLQPCSDRHFIQCFRVMSACLPRRAVDDLAGELMVAAYRRMLGHHTEAAINFMTEEVHRTCRWFPTIAECLEILGRWRRNDEAMIRRNRAGSLVRREVQARYDEAMARLAARELMQDEIDALPEGWKRQAAERCYLWRHPDGTFTVRGSPEPSDTATRAITQADVDVMSADILALGIAGGWIVRDADGQPRPVPEGDHRS